MRLNAKPDAGSRSHGRLPRPRPDLSREDDHAARGLPARRPGRRGCPRHCARAAEGAGPGGHRRQHRRRRRRARCPESACRRAGWSHDHVRHTDRARADADGCRRREVQARGLPHDRPDRQHLPGDDRAPGPAGGERRRVRRTGQEARRQRTELWKRRSRFGLSPRRRTLRPGHRDQDASCAVQGRTATGHGLGRRPDRHGLPCARRPGPGAAATGKIQVHRIHGPLRVTPRSPIHRRWTRARPSRTSSSTCGAR